MTPFLQQAQPDRWFGAGAPLSRPVPVFALLALALSGGLAVLFVAWPATTATAGAVALSGFVLASAWAGHVLRRSFPHGSLGLCNAVTLLRMSLVAALLASVLSGADASWAVFAIASVALSLDGVDGWLARRQAMVSAFGARFDMEVDAALALTLAINAALVGPAGALALVLGPPRYGFAVASMMLPWMQGDLPERFSRKVVCVVQLGALIPLQAPGFPAAWAGPAVGLTAGALIWSFALDIRFLWRRRPA